MTCQLCHKKFGDSPIYRISVGWGDVVHTQKFGSSVGYICSECKAAPVFSWGRSWDENTIACKNEPGRSHTSTKSQSLRHNPHVMLTLASLFENRPARAQTKVPQNPSRRTRPEKQAEARGSKKVWQTQSSTSQISNTQTVQSTDLLRVDSGIARGITAGRLPSVSRSYDYQHL